MHVIIVRESKGTLVEWCEYSETVFVIHNILKHVPFTQLSGIKLFAVRTQILKELCVDPEWSKRLEKAETWRDVYSVIEALAKAKGWKVKEISITSREWDP